MPTTRTLLLTATTFLTILGAIYIFHSPSTLPKQHNKTKNMSSEPKETLPTLTFHLSQISRSPPSLLVTLKNTSPDHPYTLLKWNTPLDPSAPNTGVFKLVDVDTNEELNTDFIKVARKMPPGEGDVVVVEAGAEEAVEVVLDKPWMPGKKPAKYRVWVEGGFMGVWRGRVEVGKVEGFSESEGWGKGFRSEEVVMVVE